MKTIMAYKSKLSQNGMMVLEPTASYETENDTVTSSLVAGRIFSEVLDLKNEAEEHFYCLCLNTAGKIIGLFGSCAGSCTDTVIAHREICKKALLMNATRVIVAHNHPAGTLSPSKQDLDSTNELKAALDTIGIALLDHFIVAGITGEYFSFKENGLLA